ncbi:uncharacterized protein Z518_01269 [Rhinocladiella mackenziei CBS 650.93]|uniref:Zn(2)-C6 fungal-type domain-containing protein n=1 Tax=Rhinocladiella mackenziei CBS 650.93 TaxID=1442369 RepID=A0A0D2HHN3_9EURO|nr:uncharacterized protein Z518_01269 [Rhinocladiella mackenziei CBS 650.93]KIX10188.1 hypothetical protein Z518_01269 [Rhinocladiella mackenziei CBS 650.93]
MRLREVKTCDRCRHSKRRCDLVKPTCSRCLQAGVKCSFDTTSSHGNIPSRGFNLEPPRSPKSVSAAERNGVWTTSTEFPAPGGSNHTGTDPPPGADPGSRLGRRRRACLSCLRCHRLKVRCDRQSPCSRCSASGHQQDCSYKGPESGSFPSPLVTDGPVAAAGEDPEQLTAAWHSRHRGPSHWKEMMMKILSLAQLNALPFTIGVEDMPQDACTSPSGLSGNFPFGSPQASKYGSREAVVALLHGTYTVYQTHIDGYLDVFDRVHPVLDTKSFQSEAECWLAQFLMVLGLGCCADARESNQAMEFFMAAEACLMQTPFMYRPSLSNLRTICLMVLAKQVNNSTCWGLDACWTLLGLLVRLAIISGLSQETPPPEMKGMAMEEWESRHRLWITIQYLDVKASMTTGMPPVFQPVEIWVPGKAMSCWRGEGTINSQLGLLDRSFPTIYAILSRVNSHVHQLSYQDVLQYDAEIRQLMRQAVPAGGDALLRMTLNIYFRRALLVLHRHFALDLHAPTVFPVSY